MIENANITPFHNKKGDQIAFNIIPCPGYVLHMTDIDALENASITTDDIMVGLNYDFETVVPGVYEHIDQNGKTVSSKVEKVGRLEIFAVPLVKE